MLIFIPIVGLQVGALLFWDSWTDAMSEFLLQKGYYRIESIRMQVTTLRARIWSYCFSGYRSVSFRKAKSVATVPRCPLRLDRHRSTRILGQQRSCRYSPETLWQDICSDKLTLAAWNGRKSIQAAASIS